MRIPKIQLTRNLRIALILSLGLFLLVPTQFSHAGWLFDATAGSVIQTSIAWIFLWLRSIIASITSGLIYLLNVAVYARAYNNVPVVVAIWKILRDLSNMFFILALIYMAFATIFDMGKYRFQDMIWRFLIVAVLINFSLVLGGLVIDGCQVLTNVFLHTIGNPGDKLGTFLDPSILVKDLPKDVSAGDLTVTGIVSLVFAVILSGMFMFSLLVAALFALFRVVAIWGLLAVAPIAWMANILPGTNKWWKKWWGWFFGWNLFLPVYLFIFYIGLVFLSQGKLVVQQVIGNGDATLFGTGNITVNIIFFYTFATFFMAYGTVMAVKMTTALGGSGFETGLNWAKNAIKKAPVIPYIGSLDAAEKAAKARRDQFLEKGFSNPLLNKVYGGEEGRKRMETKTQRRFGVEGALEKGVDMEKKKQKEYENDIGKLKELANSGSVEQRVAAGMRLTELGAHDPSSILKTYKIMGGDDSEAAQKYIRGIDYTKMSKEQRAELDGKITDIEARKKYAMARLEKDELKKEDVEKLIRSVGVVDSNGKILPTGDIMEILNKGEKKNIIAVSQFKAEQGIGGKTQSEVIESALKKMNDEQISETLNAMSTDSQEFKDFSRVLVKVLEKNPKRISNIATRSTGDVSSKLEMMAKGAKYKQAKPKIEQQTTKRTKETDKVNKARKELADLEVEYQTIRNQVANHLNPTSDPYKELQGQLSQIEKRRIAKENEVKSISDNITKIDEKIENLKTGDGGNANQS